MTYEPNVGLLVFHILTGSVCLALGVNSLGRRGGIVGMRLVLLLLSFAAAFATFALVGASFESDPADAIRWHAVIRAAIGVVCGAGMGAAYMLVNPHRKGIGPAMLALVGVAAAIGVTLALRMSPSDLVRTPISWFPLSTPVRIFDTVAVVSASASVTGAAIRRLLSGTRYGRGSMVLLLAMQGVVSVAYLVLRLYGSPVVMQTFGASLVAVTAVIFWAVLHRWRAAGVGEGAFALLFESMPVPAVIVDLHTDAALLNPPAHAALGGDVSAVEIFRRIGLHGPPSEVLQHNAGRKIPAVRIEGSRGVFELHFHFDAERAIGLLLLVDVTERVDHAEYLASTVVELRTMQQRLLMQEKMAALGVLVAGVNHEINNPLAYTTANVRSVQASVAALLEGVPLARRLAPSGDPKLEALRSWSQGKPVREAEADALGALREALDGCMRIQETVSSMRLLSRQGESEHSVDLSEIARAGLKIGRTNLLPGVEVSADVDGVALPVKGVAGELTRVVTNLIVNAGQALGARGRVTIRAYEDGAFAVVEVADDGPGIPAQHRARIFEPFFTTKAPGQGTGLGLAISYETAHRHHGELRLLDTPRGACFQLRIPLAAAEELTNPHLKEVALNRALKDER